MNCRRSAFVLRIIILFATSAVLSVGPLLAQEPDDSLDRDEVAAEDSASQPTRRAPTARSGPRLWGGQLFLSAALDSNIERDDEDELAAAGLGGGGLLSIQNRARRPSLLADYRASVHAYSGTDRWDRLTHRLRAFHRVELGDAWSIETAAAAATSLVTVEYRLADQVSLAPQLQYQPSRTHRLRAQAAVRHRWYRDDPRTSAWSPFIGGDYRYRWGSWHYADLGYRLERNEADLPQRNYDRASYTASYTRPFDTNRRVRLRVIHRDVSFAERRVASEGARLHDARWDPSVLYVHDLAGPLRVDAEYRWSARRSNDERRNFDSHRLALTLRYDW